MFISKLPRMIILSMSSSCDSVFVQNQNNFKGVYYSEVIQWKRTSVFHWTLITIFFAGDVYYRMATITSGVDNHYPRSMSAWNGLPDSISAAFQHSNSKTYFFIGQYYYRYNDVKIRPDSGYPRSTAQDWFECTPELVQPNTTSPSTSTTDSFEEFTTMDSFEEFTTMSDADVFLATTESAAVRLSPIGYVTAILCAFIIMAT